MSVSDGDFSNKIAQKYKTTFEGFKKFLKKDADMTAAQVYNYLDSLHSRKFNQEELPADLEALYEDLMKFRFEYYEHSWSNKESIKLFVSGFAREASSYLKKVEDQQKDSKLTEYQKMKLLMLLGTQESVFAISTALGHKHDKYPQFSSQLLVQMNEKNDKGYSVQVFYNKIALKLPGDCQDQTECDLDKFYNLLKSISYQGEPSSYCPTLRILQGASFFEEVIKPEPEPIPVYSYFALGVAAVLAASVGAGLGVWKNKKDFAKWTEETRTMTVN